MSVEVSSGSVVRSYECLREANGCGQVFQDRKPYHAMHAVACPNCSQDGLETFIDADGLRKHKIAWLPPKIRQINDLPDSIAMPALGPNVRVRSKQELTEALQRAREEYFKATDGPKTTMRPFLDAATGETKMESVTLEKSGVDLGELHVLDHAETARPQRSPFDPSLSADEHIGKLNERLGESAASPTPSEVPRKRGRPRKG